MSKVNPDVVQDDASCDDAYRLLRRRSDARFQDCPTVWIKFEGSFLYLTEFSGIQTNVPRWLYSSDGVCWSGYQLQLLLYISKNTQLSGPFQVIKPARCHYGRTIGETGVGNETVASPRKLSIDSHRYTRSVIYVWVCGCSWESGIGEDETSFGIWDREEIQRRESLRTKS